MPPNRTLNTLSWPSCGGSPSLYLVSSYIYTLLTYSPRIFLVALVPYAIFSLFHALTFTRTTILPMVFKPAPAAPRANGTASPPPPQAPLAKTIGVWVKCTVVVTPASFTPLTESCNSQLRRRNGSCSAPRAPNHAPRGCRRATSEELIAHTYCLRSLPPCTLPLLVVHARCHTHRRCDHR